jgi:formylglycine-generating enzyme required for sulfatase activity
VVEKKKQQEQIERDKIAKQATDEKKQQEQIERDKIAKQAADEKKQQEQIERDKIAKQAADEKKQLEQTAVVQTKSINGMKMIKIPGSDFFMSETGVTKGQFENFINATGYQTTADKKGGSWVTTSRHILKKNKTANWRSNTSGNGTQANSHPVIHVSWYDAVAYCQWAGVSLPTKSEWIYAAKGGANYKYAGSNNLNSVAWHEGNSGGETHPVKGKQPNGYGLYDMIGNVKEWFTDNSYAEGIYSSGSSFYTPSYACEMDDYNLYKSDSRYPTVGFRVVSH